jgi:hypothetical protein
MIVAWIVASSRNRGARECAASRSTRSIAARTMISSPSASEPTRFYRFDDPAYADRYRS